MAKSPQRGAAIAGAPGGRAQCPQHYNPSMSEQRLIVLEEKSMELERQVEELDEALSSVSADLTAVRRELARVLELFQAATARGEEEDEEEDA